MSNPQKENGYVMIANELFEAFCRTRLSGEASQVLNAIIRKTYGFNKKTDVISLSQFCLMTKMPKSSVARAVRYLRTRKIIKTKPHGYTTEYGVNKNYDEWEKVFAYDRLKIFKKDKYRCHICHSVKDVTELEVDHIVPLWLNGSNKEDNLATSCITCNRSKGAERLRMSKPVTELSQLQNEEITGDKIAPEGVTKLSQTKDNIQNTIIQKTERTPAILTKTFFKGVQDLRESAKEKKPVTSEEGKTTQMFLKELQAKYPDAPKDLLWTEIQKFERYWTEKNKTGKQQLWEMNKTFEVDRRLVTWFGRIKSFEQKQVAGKYQAGKIIIKKTK